MYDKYSNNNNELGKFVQLKRLLAGYKMIKDLAYSSGVSEGTISRIESGKQVPKPELLNRLAPFLGVESEELLIKAGHLKKEKESFAIGIDDDIIEGLQSLNESEMAAVKIMIETFKNNRLMK